MAAIRVGAVIAAASKKATAPLMQVGSIPVIKRIVLTFQQAGVFPIVVITGADEHEVRAQLSSLGVIFLPCEDSDEPELLESAKIGLSYLREKCNRVFFAPVNVPMFTSQTVRTLMLVNGALVSPLYNERSGHPLLISRSVFDDVLSYGGKDGLRGVLAELSERRHWVRVEDSGVVSSVHDLGQIDELVQGHNRALLSAHMRLTLEKETSFFDARAKLLLYLIQDVHSVRAAGKLMAVSNAKAWNMLDTLERELGYAVVERKQGGSGGGTTALTQRGEDFLAAYIEFEESVARYTQQEFRRLFVLSGRI